MHICTMLVGDYSYFLDDISKKKNVIDHSKFTNNWELNNLNRLC
jgi:hypothetical protein